MSAAPAPAPWFRSGVSRYGAALLAVAVAVGLRGVLQVWMGDQSPFITVLGAVAFAVWFGGAGPALLAAAVGFVAAASLHMEPGWLFVAWGASHGATLLSYAFSAGLIVAFGQALVRSRRRCEEEIDGRRLAQAATLVERRRLEITLNSIGEGVLVCDTDGRITSINPVAQRLTGWSETQAIGQPLPGVFDIVDHVSGEPLANPALRAMHEGAIVGLAHHAVLRPREGAPLAIEDSAAPVIGDAGEMLGAVLVFRDASAQRESERRLRQAQKALYVVVQSSPLAVVVVDREPARVRLWNGAAERLFGRSAAEAIDRPLDIVPDEQRAEHARHMAAVARAEVLNDVPTFVQRADGRRVDVQMSAAPLADDAGRVTGALLLFADLTGRLQIEDSLRRIDSRLVESEAQARLALDIARLGTWSWEVVDDVVTADARTREIVGLPTLSEAPTFRLADVVGRIHDADWWRVEAALAAAVHPDSGGRYAEEFRFGARSGPERDGAEAAEPRWVLAHGQALFDTDGPVPRVTRVLGSLLDITERKRTEEALAQADRRKDEFIATLAHELRNPLAPLRNGVHLLRLLLGPNADPAHDKLAATAKPLAIMERQIAHMVRLIDDLLDVARVSSGKFELQRHRFDIADAVHQAVETSQPLIQAAGHTLTVVLPAQPVHVDADVTRICQVIANLLNNATKYTPAGGQLRLVVQASGDRVEILVEDNGRGLAPEMLSKIFQMFTQVDRHHERSSGGLGIGLAIARRLVDMHGGELRATSRGLGQGSRFVVCLPRAEPAGPGESGLLPQGAHTVRVTDAQGELRPGLRVLVADDNTDAADSLSNIVRLMGNDSRVTHDGAAAYALAESFRPHIALLDIGMPSIDGHALARKLRAQPWGRAIKLVAVTGWGQEADLRASTEAGFDLHWVKPVDPAALGKLVESVWRDGERGGPQALP